ncbi:hypothetical protein ACTNEO_14735 [Gracilibacillus sp. HCP3S3_G5_1]
MAKWVEESGANYLDGAIMAVPPLIGTPRVLIFYGGSQELLQHFNHL